MIAAALRLAVATSLLLCCGVLRADGVAPAGQKPVKRLAFLVAVKSYRDDSAPTLPGTLRLRNLGTPCSDVDRLSSQLSTAGWNIDERSVNREVFTYCDKPLSQIETEIRNAVYNMDDPDALVVVYLAGHGAEIGGRNYFFGPGAKIDLKLTAQRMKEKLRLFGPDAFVVDTLLSEAGVDYHGNLLVLIDTCRDDPVTYRALADGLSIKTVLSPNIQARPAGTRVEYATSPGQRISDGDGSSRLAAALADNMKPSQTIYDGLDLVERLVKLATIDDTPPQTPYPIGNLSRVNWCWGACGSVESAGSLPTVTSSRRIVHSASAFSEFVHLRRASYFLQTAREAGEAPASVPAHTQRTNVTFRHAPTVTDSTRGAPTPIDLNVYWCAGSGDAERKAQADRLAQTMAALGDAPGVGGLDTILGSVRVRAFDELGNGQPGYRISRDVIRVDQGSKQEEIFGRSVAKALGREIEIEPIRANSVDSVSVFLCKGVSDFPALPRLFIQVPAREQRGDGLVLASFVAESERKLWVAPAVQVIANSPQTSQVRFFFKEDRVLATEIAGIVALRTGLRPQPILFSALGRLHPSSRGQLELWLGRNTVGVSWPQAPMAAASAQPDNPSMPVTTTGAVAS